MSKLTEGRGAGNYILSEANGHRSRANIVIAEGSGIVEAGTVLGAVLGAVGAKVSGTGDGVISAVTVGPNVQPGVYTLTGKTEGSNAGTFSVRAPNGLFLPDLTVAAAYTSTHINLTVADGANDWDIGDVITVTVTAGEYEPLTVAATDGTQIAAAICYQTVNATDEAVPVAAHVRDMEANIHQLIWPDSITDPQKATALAQLAAREIFPR